MKLTKYIVWSMNLLLLAGLTACQDFLTVEQKGRTTIPVFLSTPEGLEAGLVGSYNKAYDYMSGEFMKYGDVAGNMLTMRTTGSSTDMLSQYNYVSDPSEETGAVGYIWRRIYEAMSNANNVIQYQPDVLSAYPAQADRLRRILGQAYALRALCHFDECRVYAQAYCYTPDASHLGVPVLLRTPGPNENVSRASVAKVYEQILSDLHEAEKLLSDYSLQDAGTDVYHFNLDAVQALLARVCLYKQDWAGAYSYASKVADAHALTEGNAYLDMYRTFTTPGEALFRMNGAEMSGKLKPFYDQVALPADTLLGLYDAADLRLKLLYQDGKKYVCKYLVPDATDTKRDDPMVIRASEAYLTAAEAACQLSDFDAARGYLKPILKRAVSEAYATATLDATADADLLALVLRERVKELCFEGHNFFDLARRGQDVKREASTNSTMRLLTWPNDRYVLPIPETELLANLNMQPNPGVNQ